MPTAQATEVLKVRSPRGPISEVLFEQLLAQIPQELGGHRQLDLDLTASTFMTAGVELRLLSTLNQLDANAPGRVTVRFGPNLPLFGYLDRSGFLELLSLHVRTRPNRPDVSAAVFRRGRADTMVEIRALDPTLSADQRASIVGTLCDVLSEFYGPGDSRKRLSNQVFTVLAELIENVYIHSKTVIPGYAVLQAYPKSKRPRVELAVSDSGLGIPYTLRTAIRGRLSSKSDAQLVLEAFSQGLSRMGRQTGRGCGLLRCAQLAAEYRSELSVRTPNAAIRLKPWAFGRAHEAVVSDGVRELAGSHICFDFPLD